METKHVLFMLWIVVVLFWLVNHFYYTNQKRDLEYRKAKFAKQQGEQAGS